MKIKKIKLTNFRCFESLEMEFDQQLTVLTAPNGAGKTTILDAIATGLGPFLTRLPNIKGINPKDTDHKVLEHGKGAISSLGIEIETYEHLSWDRFKKGDEWDSKRSHKGLSQLNGYVDGLLEQLRNSQSPKFPIIVYYGTGRGVFDIPKNHKYFQKNFLETDSYHNALEAKANFKQFFEYFYFLEDLERREKEEYRDWDYQQPELRIIRDAISRMMPEFSNPRSALNPLRFLIDWKNKSANTQLRIDQLSDGYRTTLAMVMDIAARITRANPMDKNALDNEGIVLIDEVDLHLHPKWQQTILPDLMRTFPKLQFIVSTHSPQVLSTIKKEKIRLLAQNQLNEFIASIPLAHSYGEPSNDVLHGIMHVDPQPPVIEKKDLQHLTSLVDQGDYKSNEALNLLENLKKSLNINHPQIEKIERSIRRQEALKG